MQIIFYPDPYLPNETPEELRYRTSIMIEKAFKGNQKIIHVIKFDKVAYDAFRGTRSHNSICLDEWGMKVIRSEIAAENKKLDKIAHKCVICGIGFEAAKAAKYCSNACRQKNKYAKKLQKLE